MFASDDSGQWTQRATAFPPLEPRTRSTRYDVLAMAFAADAATLVLFVQEHVDDGLQWRRACSPTRHNLAYVFISHDLAVVRAMSHRVMVMQAGRVIEEGEADALFAAPRAAYTRELLAAAQLAQVVGGPR